MQNTCHRVGAHVTPRRCACQMTCGTNYWRVVLRWIPRHISTTMFAEVCTSGLHQPGTPTWNTLTARSGFVRKQCWWSLYLFVGKNENVPLGSPTFHEQFEGIVSLSANAITFSAPLFFTQDVSFQNCFVSLPTGASYKPRLVGVIWVAKDISSCAVWHEHHGRDRFGIDVVVGSLVPAHLRSGAGRRFRRHVGCS